MVEVCSSPRRVYQMFLLWATNLPSMVGQISWYVQPNVRGIANITKPVNSTEM